MKSVTVVVVVLATFSFGCSGEREIQTVSASGVESTAVIGPSGELCSKTSKKNASYVGPVLVVKDVRGEDGPTLTLTPSSSGLGGGSWSTGDIKLSFNWVDAGLSVELFREGTSVGVGVVPIGVAELALGGETLKFDSHVEMMGDAANSGTHVKAKVSPTMVPQCTCGEKGCKPGSSCCVKSGLCCSCCNAGCNNCGC